MKQQNKILLTISVLMLTLSLNAQRNLWKETKGAFSYSQYGVDYETQELLKEKENLKDNKVRYRERIVYVNGKQQKYEQKFDQDGRVVEFKRIYKDGDYLSTYQYDNNGNITNLSVTYPKGNLSSSKFTYDEANNLLNMERIDKKGIYHGLKQTFDAKGRVLSKKIYTKDKDSPVHELVYAYHETGEIQTETYYKKGNQKYQWNYDCKPEGELMGAKQKDQSTICIKVETDESGNRVIWNRDFDEKGKLIKTMMVYNSDSVLIEKKVFNNEDRLLSHTIKKEDLGIKTINYDIKGKESGSFETFLNKRQQLIKMERTGKYSFTHLFSYDDDLKTSLVRIYKQNTYVEEYNYDFY